MATARATRAANPAIWLVTAPTVTADPRNAVEVVEAAAAAAPLRQLRETGRERMGSPTLQALQDPIFLLPFGPACEKHARAAFQTLTRRQLLDKC